MSEPFMIDWPPSTAAQPASPLRPAPAFKGVKDVLIFEQDFAQFFADYAPTNLGTVHPDDSDLYLVAESPLTDLGGGLAMFTRTYAKIPDQRVDYESFAFTFPGLSPGGIYTPHLLNPTGTVASGQTTLTSQDAHGLVVGDEVFIKYATSMLVNDASSSFLQLIQTRKFTVAVVPTTTTFKVTEVLGISPQFYYVVKASASRKPLSKTVMSKVVYDYFLPGVSVGIDDVDDIPILEQFSVESGDGELSVDTVSEASDPTQAEYVDDIVGTWIVAENSVVRRWEGEIYERATRYVKAE